MSSQDDDGDWETGSEDSHESDMPSFPDWPKLFHMRPGDWFHGTKGYAQYKDEDKGHLAAYPEHSVPCSVKFLHYILHDFVLVWVATWFTRSDFEVDEILIVSSNICREVKRLQNHRELFPSKEMGEEFLDIVYDICESLEKAMAKFQGHRDLWHKLLDEEIAEVKAASWPTFQAGRNAWHQFLHNGAPGHRVIPKQASNTESMQLIPPGGLNLLQAWQTEIEDVLKTYDEHLRIHRIPSNVVGDKRSYVAVTGNIRVMGTFADANGAPIYVPESSSFLRDHTTATIMPLTQLSQDFEVFEDRVGLSNYGTSYVCVREGRGSQGKHRAAKA